MSIDVSVIIPVYNSERYLPECIESLIRQTLQACEFIFINDGSTDRSLEILEKYQQCDERIKIYNQENQGVSAARNYGIQLAKGKYIGFVDSDDMIEADYFNTLYQTAKSNDCDLVFCDWKCNEENNKSDSLFSFKVNEVLDKYYIEEFIYPYFLQYDNMNSIWNKLYLKKIIDEHKIKFPQGMKLGEDAIFNHKFFTYTNTVYYLNYNGYFYRDCEGSATRSLDKHDYFASSISSFKYYLEEYNHWGISYDELEKLKFTKLINNVLNLSYMYLLPNKNMRFIHKYQYVNKMIKNRELQQLLNKYNSELINNRSRYEKILLNFIQKRFTFGVCGVILYSQYRNNDL